MFFHRRRETYKTIDPEEEQQIMALHEEQPELGRKRLYEALTERGVDVDSFQLKRFLRDHKIGTPPPIGQRRLPWGYSRVPWNFPWFGRWR